MRQYTVPVHFTITAEDSVEAAAKMKSRLEFADEHLDTPFEVQEAEADDTSGEVISQTLCAFLDSEIDNNDLDADGWTTDLNFCLNSARDTNNGCSADTLKELERLVEVFGGTTPAGYLLSNRTDSPLAAVEGQ